MKICKLAYLMTKTAVVVIGYDLSVTVPVYNRCEVYVSTDYQIKVIKT